MPLNPKGMDVYVVKFMIYILFYNLSNNVITLILNLRLFKMPSKGRDLWTKPIPSVASQLEKRSQKHVLKRVWIHKQQRQILKRNKRCPKVLLQQNYHFKFQDVVSCIIIDNFSLQTTANLHKDILEADKRKTDLRDVAGHVKSDVTVNRRFETEVFSSIAEELVRQDTIVR